MQKSLTLDYSHLFFLGTPKLRVYTLTMKAIHPCTCTNIRRAAHSLTQFYDGILAPSGLKITQFSLLRELLLHGSLSITELAHLIDLDRTTTGKNLAVLARSGFVSFAPGEDRREKAVQVTGAGQQAFALALPLWERAQMEVTAMLKQERLELLTSLLFEVEAVSN